MKVCVGQFWPKVEKFGQVAFCASTEEKRELGQREGVAEVVCKEVAVGEETGQGYDQN